MFSLVSCRRVLEIHRLRLPGRPTCSFQSTHGAKKRIRLSGCTRRISQTSCTPSCKSPHRRRPTTRQSAGRPAGPPCPPCTPRDLGTCDTQRTCPFVFKKQNTLPDFLSRQRANSHQMRFSISLRPARGSILFSINNPCRSFRGLSRGGATRGMVDSAVSFTFQWVHCLCLSAK